MSAGAGGGDESEEAGLDHRWKDLLFDNSKIEFVIKNSFFTRWIFEKVAYGRFLILPQSSKLVPEYSQSLKMLFNWLEIYSFETDIKKKDIDEVVAFYSRTRDLLRKRYGITNYVLVPIPNKYTIYHDYADKSTVYNNYLPILSEKLADKGVICVNLYPAFTAHRDEILYWPDDTHWNGKGIGIAVASTEAVLREHKIIEDHSTETGGM